VRRALAAALAVAVAGCGANPHDPGDAHARRVLALAAHGRSIEERVGAAGRALVTRRATARETRLALQELLTQAALLREDVRATVPFGVRGRVPALGGADEVVKAASFLVSYTRGHTGGLALARAHLDAAARSFAGAAGALRPSLGEVQEEELAHLEAPAPVLR